MKGTMMIRHPSRVVPSFAALLSFAVAFAACGGGSGGGGSSAPTNQNQNNIGNGASGSTGGTTTGQQQGSQFWYVNDTFGNPFKIHGSSEAALANDVISRTNQERMAAGLSPLAFDAQAERAAKAHVEDMEGRNFFSHTTPEGWSPNDRLQMTGASGYSRWGENLALGQQTAAEVMNGWMNSAGHRANILDASFTHIGVGVAEGNQTRWAQVFLRRP